MGLRSDAAQALGDAEERLRNMASRFDVLVADVRDELQAIRRIRHTLERGPEPAGASIAQRPVGAAEAAAEFLRRQDVQGQPGTRLTASDEE